MIASPSSSLRVTAMTLLTFLVVVCVPLNAHAKIKDNCRRITIEGNAGISTNVATWKVNDNAPTPNTLAESCPMQPLPGVETNLEYMMRLAYRWGDSPTCPPLLEPTPLVEKNKCVDLGMKSCKIKYKISPKADGSKKRYVEFCCYDDNICKDKLAAPDPIPITVIVDRNGAPETCPADNCVDNCSDCMVDIDPIAMRQLPTGAGASCRDAIAKALNSYTAGVNAALAACHDAIAAGTIGATTDCNSTTEDSDTQKAIDDLAHIVNDAVDACELTRTPAEMGYDTCAAPCDTIPVAGWTDVANCLRCQTQQAAADAALAVYGPAATTLALSGPRSVLPEAQACQSVVGKAIRTLASKRASETAKCQKKVDAGAALPAGVQACKDNDAKRVVAKAEAGVISDVTSACGVAALTELGLCGGATEASTVASCVLASVRKLNESVTGASFPNGAKCLLCGQTVDGSLVRGAAGCGNSPEWPAPNGTTGSGTPSCSPPILPSVFLFDRASGYGSASVSFNGTDAVLTARLAGVRGSDGITPIDGASAQGWIARWHLRVTLGGSPNDPDVTFPDFNVDVPAVSDAPGDLSVHGSLGTAFPSIPLAEYTARNVEVLGVEILDPVGFSFAVLGVLTPPGQQVTAFNTPSVAGRVKGYLVREFSACGGSSAYPAPNTTVFGLPACAPPIPASAFKFSSSGEGGYEAQVVGEDIAVRATLKGVAGADGITPADLLGWSFREVVRVTFRDPTYGEMTEIDYPLSVPFGKVADGEGSVITSMSEISATIGVPAPAPPAQVELIELWIGDADGYSFARLGVASRD